LAKNGCTYNNNERAKLTLNWHQKKDSLIVDFTDNGIGINREEWQECFMPFYRGKTQRHTRGSGLGIALCQKIMRLHAGEISIIESGEQGTHFRLTFANAKLTPGGKEEFSNE